ncbi:methionyl-tRNA formyltransferase [Thalassospira sp. MCCC 1A01428]|uniref:methionyl-tRNA formyltransferase n=1 Tax=Thalassospira sp. MCCC 1A01428 TaxID=1470575 RepID=UPI000A1DE247|nr:methionyl-tRNA formyltransferase [Thalassospira sp. MCCC 1A01428]OSQ34937.1 methionyl-tRNA formyltransferase [Thalassospira sp. MCCC 1A01428]
MTKLRIAFMGTPDFALVALQELVKAGHDVVCVYSQPPRPAGRGHKETPTPVHAWAADHGIEVRTPVSLKSDAEKQAFADLNLDIAVVAAYGLILPKAILDAPKMGCLNIHASLLPRWRGAAPIQRAILAGDAKTGVTIMQMDVGLDTGDMLLMDEIAITPETYASGLHDDLAEMGGRLIIEALEKLPAGQLSASVQPEDGVTYAAKLEKTEGKLDFTDDAALLERKIRAFTPWPGAYFDFGKERIKVQSAVHIADASGQPGEIIDDQLTIACGAGGGLRPTRIQRPGKAAMDTEAVLRGYDKLAKGVIVS